MRMSPVGAKLMAGGGRTQWEKPSPFLLTHPNTDGGLVYSQVTRTPS